jgi:hypothetical protein
MKNKEFLVTTVTGKQLLRNQCRYINREYYEIDVDCFFMQDGRWHRINNGKIEFDHEVETYVLVDQSRLIQGVVGVDEKGNIKHGHFTPNPSKNVVLNDRVCISEKILEGKDIEEEISTGYYYTIGEKSSAKLRQKGIRNRYSFPLDHNASFRISQFSESYNKFKAPQTKDACKYSKELTDKTFGFEFETSNGFIPERKLYSHGLIPLRDGSLRHDGIEPFEFTTIPLKGNDGVNNIVNIAELLNKYTEINKQCALHVHIGGYKQSAEFVVGFHRLMLRIQDELYSMFPKNYRFTSENGFKQKDYCAPIKNIKILKNGSVVDNFLKIHNFYCNGMESFKGFGATAHPMDRDQRHKWQIDLRYYLVNIVPFIWGGSGTIEWRLHSPTLNVDKIINWLFITNGILAFTEKNKKFLAEFNDLRDINLASILSSVYSDELSAKLINYISWRKNYMTLIDPQGLKEISEDSKKIPVECSLLC